MDVDRLKPQLERLHAASFAWSVTCCGGDTGEAEEVLQTTYLKILDGRARFAGRSSLKTWLFSVIRRTAAERRRRRRLRRGLLGVWARDRADEKSEADQIRQTSESELAGRIRRALGSLSRRQAEVLDLVFYQDLSVREAAEVLGITVGSARVHYARGKKTLLARLSEEDDHARA